MKKYLNISIALLFLSMCSVQIHGMDNTMTVMLLSESHDYAKSRKDEKDKTACKEAIYNLWDIKDTNEKKRINSKFLSWCNNYENENWIIKTNDNMRRMVRLPDKDARLAFCSSNGFYYEAKRLLGYGADPLKLDENGVTALHKAAGWSHPRIIRLFLNHGACVDVEDGEGHTPLYHATDNTFNPPIAIVQTAKVLLAHNANPFKRAKNTHHYPQPNRINKAQKAYIQKIFSKAEEVFNKKNIPIAILCIKEKYNPPIEILKIIEEFARKINTPA